MLGFIFAVLPNRGADTGGLLWHRRFVPGVNVRRNAREKVVRGQKHILPTRRLSPNGFAAWAEVLNRRYEGMVAKDPESKYVGGRTLKWIKVKVPAYRVKERGFYDPDRIG